jgi:hypothetical protein
MPTGWRPADVSESRPVDKIENVYDFEKYDTQAGFSFHVWCWIQLMAMLMFISWFFGHVADIGTPGIFLYGGFIFLSIYSMTESMDRNPLAIGWELLRVIFAGYLILSMQGDWFGASSLVPASGSLVAGYLAFSLATTIRFALQHRREDAPVRAEVS